jgi:hypothetical protein
VISEHRIALYAPSDWDIALSPELAPLFVIDAAIVAAQRIFSVSLDPSSSHPGGEQYPQTRALLEAMRTMRGQICAHRIREQAFADGVGGNDDDPDPDDEVLEKEAENIPF